MRYEVIVGAAMADPPLAGACLLRWPKPWCERVIGHGPAIDDLQKIKESLLTSAFWRPAI